MEQQTLYAVLDEEDGMLPERYDNANKAEAVAARVARDNPEFGPYRVIQYTVIATFWGTDE